MFHNLPMKIATWSQDTPMHLRTLVDCHVNIITDITIRGVICINNLADIVMPYLAYHRN